MAVTPGTSLGPYEILSAVGAGGMGEVYKARDTRLDRTVAVKILPPHLSTDPMLRQRFEREARAVSSLNHPQICVVHDVGQQDGISYIVMEFLEGETLAQALERGPMPLGLTLKYAIQVADALDKAHRQGVVHRDLKPGNIMITSGSAKLMDFGLAKSTAPIAPGSSLTMVPTLASPITQQGTIVGTFQYMSPEQVEGRDTDARSDLFAFGAVLYEMLTGRRAFTGKSALSVASAVLEKDPEPLTAIAPMTPPALDRAVRKCLAKDPEERWQSARDLMLELKWIAEAGSQAGVPAVVSARRKINERVWMAATALLLLATTTLAILYYRSATKEPPVIRAAVMPAEKTTFVMAGGQVPGPVAVSPDGTKMVFSARTQDGSQALYLRDVQSALPRIVPGTAGGAMPFWSPDGKRLGFFADTKLKRIDIEGGPAQTICQAGSVNRGGAWSSRGVIVFATGPNSTLLKVADTGGTPEPATQFDAKLGETSHRWPHFLPDGNHFMYFARSGPAGTSRETNGIRVASLDGGPVKQLLRTQANAIYAAGHLLFLRDNTLFAQAFDLKKLELVGQAIPLGEQIQRDLGTALGVFGAARDGNVLVYQTGPSVAGSQLRWFDRSGKDLGVAGDQGYYLDFSLSPDGKTIAAAIVDAQGGAPPNIWMLETARAGVRSRFSFDPAPERTPVWSPDGSRVVFTSGRSGQWNMYTKSFSGSGTEELLFASNETAFATDWSRDGKWLLFQKGGDLQVNNSDIWALPITGERKPVPVVKSDFAEAAAVFSPDGRWIAYHSDESGRQEIYVAPFPGPGRKWQVSVAGGTRARWTRNGKQILYLDPNDRLTVTDVKTTATDFQVGHTTSLFDIRASRPGTVYDLSADGQRVLVNTFAVALSADPMTMVINWQEELRKKRKDSE